MRKAQMANLLIKRISEQSAKKFNQDVKAFNVTCSQMRVLWYVEENGGAQITQKDIEVFFEIAHPTAVGIIAGLEDKGFIRSAFDGTDKRMKYIYITEKGHEIIRASKKHGERWGDDIMRDFSEEELDTLISLLTKVGDNLNENKSGRGSTGAGACKMAQKQ